jgi:hypothetical protein
MAPDVGPSPFSPPLMRTLPNRLSSLPPLSPPRLAVSSRGPRARGRLGVSLSRFGGTSLIPHLVAS